MATQLYILPVIHLTDPVYNVPKYLPHRYNPALPGLEGVPWAWVTYLLEDIGILAADVTDTQNTLLSGQTDVLLIPPLDNAIPNAVARNRVRTILENFMIPGNWVNTGMTYRSILRIVLGLFQFHNRFVALIQSRMFDGSLTLNMTVSQIPQVRRDQLQVAADGLGLNYSWVTGTTTIRELLKGMSDQFTSQEYIISGAGISVVI